MSNKVFNAEFSKSLYRLMRSLIETETEKADIILFIAKLFNILESHKIDKKDLANTLFAHIIPPLLETMSYKDIYNYLGRILILILDLKTKYSVDIFIEDYDSLIKGCFTLLRKYLNMSNDDIKREFGSQVHSLNARTTMQVIKTLPNKDKMTSEISVITLNNSLPNFIKESKQRIEELKENYPPNTGSPSSDVQVIMYKKGFIDSMGIQLNLEDDSDYYIDKKIEKIIQDWLE